MLRFPADCCGVHTGLTGGAGDIDMDSRLIAPLLGELVTTSAVPPRVLPRAREMSYPALVVDVSVLNLARCAARYGEAAGDTPGTNPEHRTQAWHSGNRIASLVALELTQSIMVGAMEVPPQHPFFLCAIRREGEAACCATWIAPLHKLRNPRWLSSRTKLGDS